MRFWCLWYGGVGGVVNCTDQVRPKQVVASTSKESSNMHFFHPHKKGGIELEEAEQQEMADMAALNMEQWNI